MMEGDTMETNTRLEQFLEKTQRTIDQSLNELMEVKIIRENDLSEYSLCQKELEDLKEEAQMLMIMHPTQQEKLKEVQKKIEEIQEVLVRGYYL